MNETSKFFSDLISNSLRLLILISKFEKRKSFRLNIEKIMLYDFYMKFPKTMINDEDLIGSFSETFLESYSYFHWKPNRERYRQFLNFLLSKDIIAREIIQNDFCYRINQKGLSIISQLNTDYAKRLSKIGDYVYKNISKLSDENIEKDILSKIGRNKERTNEK
jgi:hypothetical protein